MFQPGTAKRRTETDPRSLDTMQVSNVGHLQNENKNKCSQKQQKQQPKHQTHMQKFITVPYNEGLSETFKNLYKKYGIEVHFKSGKTIKDELVAPKDKDHITKKSGVIYRYKFDMLECDEEYIGETVEHLERGLKNI